MATLNCTEVIQKSQVSEQAMLDFLPSLFGLKCIEVELLVFAHMEHLSPDYHGGSWVFYRLSNGGFFMRPDREEPMHLEVSGNWFSGDMSAEAAGIVACLFALGQLSASTELGSRYFHRLREFALDHAEAALIFRAID